MTADAQPEFPDLAHIDAWQAGYEAGYLDGAEAGDALAEQLAEINRQIMVRVEEIKRRFDNGEIIEVSR